MMFSISKTFNLISLTVLMHLHIMTYLLVRLHPLRRRLEHPLPIRPGIKDVVVALRLHRPHRMPSAARVLVVFLENHVP